MKLAPKFDEFCRNAGIAIHRDWQDPKQVANHWGEVRKFIFKNELDVDTIYKRIGDYMRQCFDRQPKTRDVPLEQATADLQKFVDYWNQEM